MKKIALLVPLFIITILLSGCVNTANEQESNKQVETPAAVNTPVSTEVDSESVQDKEDVVETVKEFSITAKRWQFEPSQIIVNKGDKVKLVIKSIDVKHGFSIPDFNVKSDLNPGQETVIEFTANKVGSFTFSCSVICGSGHGNMKGILIVQ